MSPGHHLPIVAQIALAAIPALCTLVLALAQPGGRPLEEWLLAIARYAGQPKVCIWRPLADEEGGEGGEGEGDAPEHVAGATPRLSTASEDTPVQAHEWATIPASENREGDPA